MSLFYMFCLLCLSVHEELSVFEAGITQGSHLVLEPGPSPNSDEVIMWNIVQNVYINLCNTKRIY